MAESYARSVGEIADQYGLVKTQLFTWRREARPPREGRLEPAFAPVVLEQPIVPAGKTPSLHKLRRAGRGGIELEIDGVVVRVDRGAKRKTVSAVIPGAEGAAVIAPPAGVKVLVATKPIDLRWGAGGLAALMRADPFSGVVYVFRAKRADWVKLLYWNGTGLVLVAKTLEQGVFRWPRIPDGAMRLSASQLSALLDGMD